MRKSRRLLTHAKAARVQARKPAIIKGKVLNPPTATAAKYRAALDKLVAQMVAETEREIAALFASPAAVKHFAQDESIAHAAARMTKALEKRFAALFDSRANSLADWLVKSTDKASASSLHASLKDLSGGLSLKTNILTGPLRETMTAIAKENASLVKSIPEKYLSDLEQQVMRSITTGNGLADLQPWLEKQEGMTKRRAKTIAEDQTRKAYGAINAKRMQAVGLTKFEWVHSGGGAHPRELHVGYDGKVFDFANPPIIDEKTQEHGLPGQAINCRCKAIPVLSADEVEA